MSMANYIREIRGDIIMYKKCLVLIMLIGGLFFQICFAESVTIKSSLSKKDGEQ